MNAVILFSHGSLLCGSGESLKAHAARLKQAGIAPIVEFGYLNYTDPAFADTVRKCAAAGATKIIVTPYFLVPGYFVKVDLPKAVDLSRAEHPGIEFVVVEAIGFDERLADALIESASQPMAADLWRDDLKRAPDHCLANPLCPLYGTIECRRQPFPPNEAS